MDVDLRRRAPHEDDGTETGHDHRIRQEHRRSQPGDRNRTGQTKEMSDCGWQTIAK